VSKRRRTNPHNKFVMLERWFWRCPAWQALPHPARSLYVEMELLYDGQNNGSIEMGVRKAMRLLQCSFNFARKMFAELEEKGFIKPNQRGSFSWKARHETTWILTKHALKEAPATSEYMRWRQLEKQNPDAPRASDRRSTSVRDTSDRPPTDAPQASVEADSDPFTDAPQESSSSIPPVRLAGAGGEPQASSPRQPHQSRTQENLLCEIAGARFDLWNDCVIPGLPPIHAARESRYQTVEEVCKTWSEVIELAARITGERAVAVELFQICGAERASVIVSKAAGSRNPRAYVLTSLQNARRKRNGAGRGRGRPSVAPQIIALLPGLVARHGERLMLAEVTDAAIAAGVVARAERGTAHWNGRREVVKRALAKADLGGIQVEGL
jgi:hypothetical protein